jgi:ADP-heptose:LPS heptosyltransferase
MNNSVVSLVGNTTIGQYLALLSRCHLVVMNDGGPLHMAVAAGTKTVSLIGPVDEHVYGPYPVNGHQIVTTPIACRPCYRQFRRADCEHIGCLAQIQVDDVFKKAENILTGV